jgi:hypothetical protein
MILTERHRAQTALSVARARVAEALDRFSETYSQEVVSLVFARIEKAKQAAEKQVSKLKLEVGYVAK